MIALIAALWAYDGWSDVTHAAGEIQNPRRSLPLALVGGVGIVGVLYMLTNAAIQYVLPAATIANSDRPAVAAILLSVGPAGAWIFSVGLAISYGSTFIGSALTGARVPFAAARDGLFFRGLAYVHPRFKTPSRALILQATSALFRDSSRWPSFRSGSFTLPSLQRSSSFAAARRLPRAQTAPVTCGDIPSYCALHRSSCCAAGLLLRRDQPRNSLIGSAIILFGIPLYYIMNKRPTLAAAVLNHPLVHAYIFMRRSLPRKNPAVPRRIMRVPLVLILEGAQRTLQRSSAHSDRSPKT